MYARNKYFNKALLFLFTTGLLLCPAVLLAQDESCLGQDPTGNTTTCPLDTWVWILVIGAAIFGVISLKRRRKLYKPIYESIN